MVVIFLAVSNFHALAADFTVKVHGDPDPSLSKEISEHTKAGVSMVEAFFGGTYPKPFTVDVYTSRTGLDELFKKRWNAPPTEKWMVAAGIGDGLFMLSPRVWKSEAQGHEGDPEEVERIVTHELTHVFHAQQNPNPEFDGMDKMAWLIEGVATYVAGQLEGRGLSARQAIDAGKAPKSLSDAWSGSYRYGVCGAIVRFVDVTYGRKKLNGLLKLTSTEACLKSLGTDEKTLLKNWKAYELRRTGP